MEFVYSDGGRSKYFKAENVGDCVCRAICNATGKDYKEVYNRLKELAKLETQKQIDKYRGGKRSSVRDGVKKETFKKYLDEIGWIHVSTTSIGSRDRKLKLCKEDLPSGNLIVQISKHLTNVKDGVIYDTYNCSQKMYYDSDGELQINNERCVYGYWKAPTQEDIEAKEIAKKNKELDKLYKDKMKKEIKKVKDRYNKKIKELEKERDKKLKEIEKKYANQLMDAMINI